MLQKLVLVQYIHTITLYICTYIRILEKRDQQREEYIHTKINAQKIANPEC